MKTLAGIIHARKDSTRCPNKHLRDLNGTTLIDIALEKLSRLDLDEKYLAVYDQELKDKVIDGVKYYTESMIQLHQVIVITQLCINILMMLNQILL